MRTTWARYWLVAAIAAASASIDADTAPFDQFIGERSITVSSDGYRVWVYWNAEKATLGYPGRTPFKHNPGTEDKDLLVMLEATCRADGRAHGTKGPEPVRANLSLPMHPDTWDVPSFFTPGYWWRVLGGNDATSTSVTATVGTGKGHRSQLVERHVDWSFSHPQLLVWLPPEEAMRALLEGKDTTITVRGEGVHIELEFSANRALGTAAGEMAEHCPS